MQNIKRSILCLFLAFSVVFFPTVALGQTSNSNGPPSVEAQNAILIEQHTGKVLYTKNENAKSYPASTTKILTALIAIESGNLDDIITVSNEVNLIKSDGTKAGLHVGEQISLENLIRGILLPSGNDAANTAAVYIARKMYKNDKMSIDEALSKFTEIMNKRAKDAGATSSHFANAHGYHDPEHYTTAHDLAMISRQAMKYDFFREVVSTCLYSMEDPMLMDPKDPAKHQIRYWLNTNKLINEKDVKYYYPFATGIKTGFTSLAGQCLVSSASDGKLDLIAVVLNSSKDGKWTDSINLFDYGFANFEHYQLTKKGQVIQQLDIENHADNDNGILDIVTPDDLVDIFDKKDIPNMKRIIEIQSDIKAPIYKGQKLGKITYILNGHTVSESDLIAGRDMEKKSIPNLSDNLKKSGIHFAIKYWAVIIIVLITILFILIKIKNKRRRRRYWF